MSGIKPLFPPPYISYPYYPNMEIIYGFDTTRYCYKLMRALGSEKPSSGNLRGISRAVEKFRVSTTYLVVGFNASVRW